MYDENVTEDVIKAYREVFGTLKGKKVLAHMLVELGFFDEVDPTNIEAIALQNYAKHLLYRCALFRGEKVEDIVDLLFKIPFKEE